MALAAYSLLLFKITLAWYAQYRPFLDLDVFSNILININAGNWSSPGLVDGSFMLP
ncbi:MAG: hypothetical protein P9M14_04365 [Candidatus Alcyoniella australis]|nr:hypothetical protein [Candidatus Alcyoniella australis]